MSRALVTGASGFIGARLAEELVRLGHEVACLVRRTSLTGHLAGLPLRFVEGDLRDAAALEPAVRGADLVFHLAGVINATAWRVYEAGNVLGTKNLLEACLRFAPGLRSFVYASSIAAAGPAPEGTAVRESDDSRPVSDYGRSKLLAEREVLAAKDRLPVSVLRPTNVLGPRQKELWQSIRLVRRRILPLVGDRKPRTSLVYVDDVVRALILAAGSPAAAGDVFFVTDGRRPYAWREITAAIAAGLGVRRFLLKVPYAVQLAAASLEEGLARARGRAPRLTRSHVVGSRRCFWIYDAAKIGRVLGFRAEDGLESAVAKTIAWYRERGMISPRRAAEPAA